MNVNCYYDSLASACYGAIANADAARALLVHPAEVHAVMGSEHLSYGQVRNGDFELELYRDRPTKKYFHVVITRLDSGRYELVTYVL